MRLCKTELSVSLLTKSRSNKNDEYGRYAEPKAAVKLIASVTMSRRPGEGILNLSSGLLRQQVRCSLEFSCHISVWRQEMQALN